MKKTLDLGIRISLILIGSFISAISLNCFIIPHKLLSGGVTGISLILEYLCGLPSGYLILAFNIPIFLYGLRKVDKEFALLSIVGTFGLSLFLVLTRSFSVYIKVDDILLSCIYGGVLGGIGVGMTIKNRGSQGGIDIISVIIKKEMGINIGAVSLFINFFIVAIGIVTGSIQIALYTLIAMYIGSVSMDRIIDGFDRKKLLFIVTDREREVADNLMKQIGRGVTFLYGEGAYTGNKRNVIYCIVSSFQVVRAKKIVEEIDKGAFISIMDTAEVKGRGFKNQAF